MYFLIDTMKQRRSLSNFVTAGGAFLFFSQKDSEKTQFSALVS